MPTPLLDPKIYKQAVNVATDIEDSLALTLSKFDKTRWPKLKFTTFKAAGATAAVSPDCSYRFLKKAINAAQSTLLLYIYDVSAPYLLDLLAAAKQRGVAIKSMYDANSQGAAEKAKLKAVGETKAAPSKDDRAAFTVCHQKFLVIDNKTLVLESANWAKSSVPEIQQAGGFKKANREWFIRFDNPQIAAWFAGLFEADWNIPESTIAAAGEEVAVAALRDVAMLAAVQRPSKIFDFEVIADPQAKVLPLLSPDNYLTQVKALLKKAEKSIYLQQQYVLAGEGVKDLLTVLAQKRVDKPDFDIRVISSATFPENWQGTKLALQSAGLLNTLKAINPASFAHCHNKGVIVDGKSVVISSTNWSMNSIMRAREAGVLVQSAKIAKYYQDVFLVDWQEGLLVDQVEASLTVLDGADAL